MMSASPFDCRDSKVSYVLRHFLEFIKLCAVIKELNYLTESSKGKYDWMFTEIISRNQENICMFF